LKIQKNLKIDFPYSGVAEPYNFYVDLALSLGRFKLCDLVLALVLNLFL
jgi:hypothetical protein